MQRRIIETHQTWTDCMIELTESHPALITKAVDQLAKDFKKMEKASKLSDGLNDYQPDSEFEEFD
jgi:hypothetical protein